MPRVARIVLPQVPHHITQRGNNRQDVFFTDDDRRLYRRILHEECQRWGLSLLGYCLMTNHVHLIAVPHTPNALARAVGRTHWRYAHAINRLHERSGHLWQNRFYSAPLDHEHLLVAMRYVEQNPSRAGLCARPWEYPWSSAAIHCGWVKAATDVVLDAAGWQEAAEGLDWAGILRENLETPTLHRLRHATANGRPLADDAWLSRLETTLNRRLRPRPLGRPRKRVRVQK
jgi:putative transposase